MQDLKSAIRLILLKDDNPQASDQGEFIVLSDATRFALLEALATAEGCVPTEIPDEEDASDGVPEYIPALSDPAECYLDEIALPEEVPAEVPEVKITFHERPDVVAEVKIAAHEGKSRITSPMGHVVQRPGAPQRAATEPIQAITQRSPALPLPYRATERVARTERAERKARKAQRMQALNRTVIYG